MISKPNGDDEGDQAHRYGRTAEFMRLVRRLWTETGVTHSGANYSVVNSTAEPRITPRGGRLHPPLYFGGASAAAERVAAAQADVQVFWGEPRDGISDRIARLMALSREVDRDLPPLEFGLLVTTFIRDSREEAWRHAQEKVAHMAQIEGAGWHDDRQHRASQRVPVLAPASSRGTTGPGTPPLRGRWITNHASVVREAAPPTHKGRTDGTQSS